MRRPAAAGVIPAPRRTRKPRAGVAAGRTAAAGLGRPGGTWLGAAMARFHSIALAPAPAGAQDGAPAGARDGAPREPTHGAPQAPLGTRGEGASGTAWHGALPAGLAGRWCLVRVPELARGTAARLLLSDSTRGHVVREAWLGPASGRPWQAAMLHMPQGARELRVLAFGPDAAAMPSPRALVRALPRAAVALRLGLLGAPSLPGALRGSPLGLIGRVRAVLGRGARAAAPDYAAWVRQFDAWDAADRARLAARPGPPIRAVVVAGAPAALRATLESLDRQWRRPAAVTVADGAAALPAGLRAASPGDYVALLAAGEVLAPHALALVGWHVAQAGDGAPDVVHADWDRLTAAGRADPCLLPGGGERLLLSGLPARGPCLFRAAALAGVAAEAVGVAAASAGPLRLAAWLALHRAGQGTALHLPFVLAHRRDDAAEPEAGALAAVVRTHLAARDLAATLPDPAPRPSPVAWPDRAPPPARVHPAAAPSAAAPSAQAPAARAPAARAPAAPPLRLRWRARGGQPVSVVVASACRSGHVWRCLRRLLRDTTHHGLELLVAVSAIDPVDRRQAAVLARVRALPHTRVLALGLPAFNYARVNNLAVAQARHETVLLLNDDVAPIRPDWLGILQAHLEDPAVGAVGARLLYGNGAVQHAGVVLGLGGLAEHADRLRPSADPGPFGLGDLDREVSAVTAACLLLRRADWQALGGMDERFAVALNDVDLCLRLRAAGRLVVQANGAVLHHYESLSLGRHYSGARAALEATEVGLLRRLWGPVLAADPCYSPNLSLEAGREWTPAWPPRVTRYPGSAA